MADDVVEDGVGDRLRAGWGGLEEDGAERLAMVVVAAHAVAGSVDGEDGAV